MCATNSKRPDKSSLVDKNCCTGYSSDAVGASCLHVIRAGALNSFDAVGVHMVDVMLWAKIFIFNIILLTLRVAYIGYQPK